MHRPDSMANMVSWVAAPEVPLQFRFDPQTLTAQITWKRHDQHTHSIILAIINLHPVL